MIETGTCTSELSASEASESYAGLNLDFAGEWSIIESSKVEKVVYYLSSGWAFDMFENICKRIFAAAHYSQICCMHINWFLEVCLRFICPVPSLRIYHISGVLSGYARHSVNTLGYKKNICSKKVIIWKPKIQCSHLLLHEISTLDCHY